MGYLLRLIIRELPRILARQVFKCQITYLLERDESSLRGIIQLGVRPPLATKIRKILKSWSKFSIKGQSLGLTNSSSSLKASILNPRTPNSSQSLPNFPRKNNSKTNCTESQQGLSCFKTQIIQGSRSPTLILCSIPCMKL